MEKEQKFNLDDLFREAAEAHDPPYQDAYWEDASAYIQKKKGNNRRFLMYLIWGALLSSTMALAGYWWVDSPPPGLAQNAPTSTGAWASTGPVASNPVLRASTHAASQSVEEAPSTQTISASPVAHTTSTQQSAPAEGTQMATPARPATVTPEKMVAKQIAAVAQRKDKQVTSYNTSNSSADRSPNQRAENPTLAQVDDIPTLSSQGLNQLSAQSAHLFNLSDIPEPQFGQNDQSLERIRRPNEWNWGFGVKFGASYNLPSITKSLDPNIRVSEQPIITKNGGIDLVLYRNQWFANTGLLYQSYHTDLEYTYQQVETIQKSVVVDRGAWIIREVIVEVHDSIFIDDPSGPILRIDTISHRIEDSTYVPNSDTLLVEFEDTNDVDHRVSLNHSYVEVPLLVGYEFGKKRFTFGLMTGISVGFLTQNQSMPYIYSENEELIPIADGYRKVLLNYQVQGRIKYQWNRVGLYSDLFWKTNLNYLYENNEIINLKYDALGAQIGLFYRF